MHQALGEFVTECGRVEFLMVAYADYISEPGIERIVADLSGPFGHKIKQFKSWCNFSGVPEHHKSRVESVYTRLDKLLPIRNFLIHGETHERAFPGRPTQPYRVGTILQDPDYLDPFERGERAPHIFDLERVRAATELCRQVAEDLHALRYGA